MKVFFSFDYYGGKAYLGMKEQPLMMDVYVTEIQGLLEFLQLRLGLHTRRQNESKRLVTYYKCVRRYMKVYGKDTDNQLYESYKVSPLATSREMLRWRDALAICGWSKDTPAPSPRLKALQGVEEYFAETGITDDSICIKSIVRRLKQKKGMMKDITFIMPFDPELLHPVIKEIFDLAEADGAQIEQISTPEIVGNNNLAKLKRLLTSQTADSIELAPADDSVKIWNFKDDMKAEEYLSMMDDDSYDVTIQPNNKLTDNFLHMMGKPVTGSIAKNSAPQIIQLFFTGVGMLARPLNIGILLQWLYAPIHPLPNNFRYRLAERLARNGGWMPESTEEDNNDCYHLVKDWIEGKIESEKGEPLDEKELSRRRFEASVFLPDFDGGSEDTLTAQKLHLFLTELSAWSRQRTIMITEKDGDDLRISQLNQLAELCDILKSLTDDVEPTDILPYVEIEKHMACLYKSSEFPQYGAQATSRFTVSEPGQIAAKANKVLWSGLYNFELRGPATDFLTPSEQQALEDYLRFWNQDDVRKMQLQSLLMPLHFCQKQLTLVTIGTVNNEIVKKHPLIVRIEQQVKNHEEITSNPKIEDECYVDVDALTDNTRVDCDGYYSTIKKTDLIRWNQHESPTSLDKLMQNPLDYAMENIANISDNGQSALRDIALTKGNVAHAVIQHLFYIPGDVQSGYPSAIRARVEANYKEVFDKIIETKGAILLLEENTIERRQLFELLYECIDHLIDIIEKNSLHVTGCEMQLDGNTLGTPDDVTPSMHGFADMVLAYDNGQHVIFDFKWTSSKNYYQSLLEKNRSSQLAIYANLLGELTDDHVLPTAYFLMPIGRLFSTENFQSHWAKKIELSDDSVKGDIISKIVASYRYRRDEIMSGKIEMAEGMKLEDLAYFNDTETYNLFPLKSDYDDETLKEVYGFSNFGLFKE